jgi:hypothetical protein
MNLRVPSDAMLVVQRTGTFSNNLIIHCLQREIGNPVWSHWPNRGANRFY